MVEIFDMRGIDQAYWLADKIPAYGDYAKEAANVLRRQAYELERLHKENEKLRRVVKASEEFVSAESLVDKRKFYIELEQVLRATGYGIWDMGVAGVSDEDVALEQALRDAGFVTPNDLGNRRDGGPIGGASVLTDGLGGR